jgi:uncharacterized membrane protein YbhN (UPF0104 family)
MAHITLNNQHSILTPRRRPSRAAGALGFGALALAAWVVAVNVDTAAFGTTLARMLDDPAGLAVGVGAFAAAFALRAVVWTRLVPGLSLGHAWAAIHVALGGNHVLPLRLGEPLRVLSVVRRGGIAPAVGAASTVVLRLADFVALATLAMLVAPALTARLAGWWGLAGAIAVAAAALAAWRWLVRVAGVVPGAVRLPGPSARLVGFALVTSAWALEAVLVYEAARWAGIELGVAEAVVVGTVAVAAQTVAIAPGGFGTYEAAAVAAYIALGHDARLGLAAALAAHGVKTVYSLATGVVAVVAPAPGLLGRQRLAVPVRRPAGTVADGPVVLFMPAHDEAATVGALVTRVPSQVAGRSVATVVVDDGSADATAARAHAAGATVLSMGGQHGLGAAVRAGLADAVARGAAVVAFCDADAEYAPEELAAVVTPILAGDADYVVGSRFGGQIHHMRPHRRLGNLVLTRWLRWMARVPVTDGQSGYRALSAAAARDAEIVHDYNYAQVLTLDLVAKGYRYAEVPISYRFRTTGSSFVRLGRYLRHVVPAVHRELNGEDRNGGRAAPA